MNPLEFKTTLKQLELEEIEFHQPFKFVYAISQTEKSVLFKLKNHLTSFVPKSVLRWDKYGISGQQKGWIWIRKSWIPNIIKEHANEKVEL